MDKFEQLIPRRQGYKMMGLSNATGWRRERQDPEFPKAVAIGPRRFGFLLSHIENYIATRPRAVIVPPLPQTMQAQKAAHEKRRRIRELEAELERERRKATEAEAISS